MIYDILNKNPKGDDEPVDFFKVKNGLLVGKDAFISGNLFVSGQIFSNFPESLDGGTPEENYILEGSHGN